MNRWIVLSLLALLIAGCTPYRATHQLAYGPLPRQTYDFYEPRINVAGSPRPALLVIHGGGYVTGDKSWAKAVAEKFCPWGYVVVAMNYTLAGPSSPWPVQLADAMLALEHMRGPTTDWMNIRRPIAGFGVSAGAHLVSALHLQGDLPLAIAASGVYDFVNESTPQLDGTLRALLGLSAADPIPSIARHQLSPVSWANSDGDILLVHSKWDPLTDYRHAERFEAALQAAGAKVELATVDNDSHSSAWKDATWAMRRWLNPRQ